MYPNESFGLHIKGAPALSTRAVLHATVYGQLLHSARSRLPAETCGLLLGKVYASEAVRVADVTGYELLPAATASNPTPASMRDLLFSLESAQPDVEVVGWFCADPGVGLFPARIELNSVQATLPGTASLFLLVNPVADEGAFYLSSGGMYTPLGGFYEVVAAAAPGPEVPWNGKVRGAEKWFGVALAPANQGSLGAAVADAEAASEGALQGSVPTYVSQGFIPLDAHLYAQAPQAFPNGAAMNGKVPSHSIGPTDGSLPDLPGLPGLPSTSADPGTSSMSRGPITSPLPQLEN